MKLTEQQKSFIVLRLACLYTPSEVVGLVLEEYDVKLTRQHVAIYDPRKAQGGRLSQDLKKLFDEAHTRFLENLEDIPIANRAFRLRALNDLFHSPKVRNNPKLQAQLLEQAAKEAGGAFTNRTELTGKDGGPIEVEQKMDLSKLTDRELEEFEVLVRKCTPDDEG
jgi:hypothetical protein